MTTQEPVLLAAQAADTGRMPLLLRVLCSRGDRVADVVATPHGALYREVRGAQRLTEEQIAIARAAGGGRARGGAELWLVEDDGCRGRVFRPVCPRCGEPQFIEASHLLGQVEASRWLLEHVDGFAPRVLIRGQVKAGTGVSQRRRKA